MACALSLWGLASCLWKRPRASLWCLVAAIKFIERRDEWGSFRERCSADKARTPCIRNGWDSASWSTILLQTIDVRPLHAKARCVSWFQCMISSRSCRFKGGWPGMAWGSLLIEDLRASHCLFWNSFTLRRYEQLCFGLERSFEPIQISLSWFALMIQLEESYLHSSWRFAQLEQLGSASSHYERSRMSTRWMIIVQQYLGYSSMLCC